MARTKASVGSKVSSGKSSKARCCAAPPPSSSSSSSSDKSSKTYSGGNPMCPRETPNWQKPITNFFVCKDDKPGVDCDEPATSSRPKRNIIESDEEVEVEVPKNTELDESINLEPLTGEECHKIEEYYCQQSEQNGAKGKGVGKKTRGKENDNNNVSAAKRNSIKRDLEFSDDETQNSSKKVKVK